MRRGGTGRGNRSRHGGRGASGARRYGARRRRGAPPISTAALPPLSRRGAAAHRSASLLLRAEAAYLRCSPLPEPARIWPGGSSGAASRRPRGRRWGHGRRAAGAWEGKRRAPRWEGGGHGVRWEEGAAPRLAPPAGSARPLRTCAGLWLLLRGGGGPRQQRRPAVVLLLLSISRARRPAGRQGREGNRATGMRPAAQVGRGEEDADQRQGKEGNRGARGGSGEVLGRRWSGRWKTRVFWSKIFQKHVEGVRNGIFPTNMKL